MGKKTFIENADGTEEVVETSNVKSKKEEKNYRLATRGANIKSTSRSFKDKFFMSYKDGVKLIKKMGAKGKKGQIVQKKAVRHVSLPYHMSGKDAMDEACNWIAQNTVGKYRKEYKGIVVAVGEIETASVPRVIGDQYAFHKDIYINQIVFIPKYGDQYEAKVKYVQEGLMVGVVMDMITIHIKQNNKTSEDSVAVNDKIMVKYTGIRIKSSLCHLIGSYVELVEKAEIVEEAPEDDEDVGEVEDVKQEVTEIKEEVEDMEE